MKLIIPHPDDYRLNPPPQLLWVMRHYCPILAESLSFSVIDRFMKLKKGTTFDPQKNVICNMYGPLVCIYGDSFWEQKKTIFGEEIVANELRMSINFLQSDSTALPRRETFKFDSHLYLIPYLFRTTLKLREGSWGYTIYSVDERWDKMINLGILPPNINKWNHE